MKTGAKIIWLATVDGAQARFFALDHSGEALKLIAKGAREGTRAKSGDLVSDQPGRGHESVGTTRHAMEPRTDPKVHAEEVFAATIARELAALGQSGAFDALILVAAPKQLGNLRKEIDPDFREQFVMLEIPGDWTNLPIPELAAHLQLHFDQDGRPVPYASPERPLRT